LTIHLPSRDLDERHSLLSFSLHLSFYSLLLFHHHVNERRFTLLPLNVVPGGKPVRPDVREDNSWNLFYSYFKLIAMAFRLWIRVVITNYSITNYSILQSLFWSPSNFPVTSLTGDNHLVENIGVEPMTSCLQSRRSSQLS
jgi:hypothetical protein